MTGLKRYLESNGMKAKDIVEVVQEIYPKYDKSLQSKVDNVLYGVRLKADARALVFDRLGIPADILDGKNAPQAKKAERRKTTMHNPLPLD